MLWKDNTLAYQYISRKTGVQVAVLSHAAVLMFSAMTSIRPGIPDGKPQHTVRERKNVL